MAGRANESNNDIYMYYQAQDDSAIRLHTFEGTKFIKASTGKGSDGTGRKLFSGGSLGTYNDISSVSINGYGH